MKYLFFATAIVLVSCADEPAKEPENLSAADKDMQNVLAVHSTPSSELKPIGSSGFSIELPSDFRIDSSVTSSYKVYYFEPVDTNAFHGEAGIYIGKHPQDKAPQQDFTKSEFSAVWIGQTVKWTEYKMNPNTQRETFVELNDSTKIHCWYYSDRSSEVDRLSSIVNTIIH